jgi:hypothetical protein
MSLPEESRVLGALIGNANGAVSVSRIRLFCSFRKGDRSNILGLKGQSPMYLGQIS